MQCLNEVTLLGRLGARVTKYNLHTGTPFVTFTVGTNEKVKNATEEKEIRNWHQCEAWGNMATIIDRLNIGVGQELLIKGKLRNSSYQDAKSHENRTKTSIVVMDIKVFPIAPKTTTYTNNQTNLL